MKETGLITIEAKIKKKLKKNTIDVLDVKFKLPSQKYLPYMKPGNVPTYIHTKSNHPPSAIEAVPEGINKRLSDISADQEYMFQKGNSRVPRGIT